MKLFRLTVSVVLFVFASLSTVSLHSEESGSKSRLLLGDFSGGTVGGIPPKPWEIAGVSTASTADGSIVLDTLPDVDKSKLWVHFSDNSSSAAPTLVQSFAPLSAGALQFKFCLKQAIGTVCFYFMETAHSGKKEGTVLLVKIKSKGEVSVSDREAKVENQVKSQFRFRPGEAYVFKISFKPENGLMGVVVTVDGVAEPLFQGNAKTVIPIQSLRVRSQVEETGVEFFLTDLSLIPEA